MIIRELSGTTDALGAATITDTQNTVGYLEKIVADYDDGDAGADITVTNESKISEPILTKANIGAADTVFYPRTPANLVADGAALTNWADKIFVTGTFKIVIAQGGDTKNFKFFIYCSDE